MTDNSPDLRVAARASLRAPEGYRSQRGIGRLGGAASGRYRVVIFAKRNPTKCSGRFMSVLGCAPASLHPTYDYCRLGLDRKGEGQIAAPPSGTSGSRAVPAAGARKDEASAVTAYLTSRILRSLSHGHCETLCQRDCWVRDCNAWQRVVAVRINICWWQRLDNGYVSVSIEN